MVRFSRFKNSIERDFSIRLAFFSLHSLYLVDAQLLSGNTTTPTVKCRQQAAEIDRENKVLIWRWVLLKLSELEMWA